MGDPDSPPFNGDVYPRIWFAGELPPEGQPPTTDMPSDCPDESASMKVASTRRVEKTKNAGACERNGGESGEKPDGWVDDETLPGDDETSASAGIEEEGEEDPEQRLVIDFDDGSLAADSEMDAKRRKRKSFRPQKYQPGARREAPAIVQDHLAGEAGQQTGVEDWKVTSEFDRQREYNREYKRKRRSNPDVRAKERERQKEYQRLRRSDPTFVAMERQKRKNRQQEKCTDPDLLEKRRARQREYARARRANPEYAAREREKNRLYQKQRREDPVFVVQEREKQRHRLELLRQKRANPEFAAKEREKNREYQRQKRMDLAFLAKEREKRKERIETVQMTADERADQTNDQFNVSPERTECLSDVTHRSEIVTHPMIYGSTAIVEGDIEITYETSNVIVNSKNEENNATAGDPRSHCNEQMEDFECQSGDIINKDGKHDSNANLSNNPNNTKVSSLTSNEHRNVDSSKSNVQRLKEVAVQGPVVMDRN
ncbi:zinc finger CCCH domain-containing protein 13-like [Corticium candelabrum]|uniref:zinc finger CCCH domain-containing protein 13-like n=1 Tax=Corticium candelabrum TaxID=121492 RepID=UPI002E25E8A9|nr:zinc finger CCCH domain-containing protein 13-like [Corticium candelabrum]